MADRMLTARTIRKGFAVDPGGGGGTVRLKNKRIATAAELGLAEHLAVLDEATELPPFGFNIAGLEQRLERRLGLEITPAAINECLSPYYNLREWEERYVVTSLGEDIEDFPGEGSGNRPPRSPLKEFHLFSEDEDDNADDGGGSSDGQADQENHANDQENHDVGGQGYHHHVSDDVHNDSAQKGEGVAAAAATAAAAAGGGRGAESVGGGGARSGGGAGGGAAASSRPRHPAAGSFKSFGCKWHSSGRPGDGEGKREGGIVVIDSDAMNVD